MGRHGVCALLTSLVFLGITASCDETEGTELLDAAGDAFTEPRLDVRYPTSSEAGTTADTGLTCPHRGKPVVSLGSSRACSPYKGAHCVASGFIPDAEWSQFARCSEISTGYDSGFGFPLCVPDLFIETGGNFILTSCSSIAGAEGRCMTMALPAVEREKDRLPRDTCQEFERCLPCFDPVTGIETGVCKQSCDPGPSKPKVVFEPCCVPFQEEALGRCVPETLVPAELRSGLLKDTCAGSKLCAPVEELTPGLVHSACTGFSVLLLGLYEGVCVSECIDFGGFVENALIPQGSCPPKHLCAPCRDPFGNPTGAPDCPK